MPKGMIPANKAKKGKTIEQCKSDMMGKNMKGIAQGKRQTMDKRPYAY
jgi:hypothetical protein